MNLIDRLLAQSVTIVARTQSGPNDEMGDPSWVETTTEAKGYLYQTSRSDQTAGQELGFQEFRLVLDAGAVADHASRVIIDGTTYEVYGDPWYALNPRTKEVSHLEATVRRTA